MSHNCLLLLLFILFLKENWKVNISSGNFIKYVYVKNLINSFLSFYKFHLCHCTMGPIIFWKRKTTFIDYTILCAFNVYYMCSVKRAWVQYTCFFNNWAVSGGGVHYPPPKWNLGGVHHPWIFTVISHLNFNLYLCM